MEVELQIVNDFARFFGQTIFLYQRHYGQFHRCQCSRQLQDNTGFTAIQRLFTVGSRHDAKEHAVYTDTSLDDIRGIAFVGFRIEILDVLAGELLMLGQVEICTAVNTLYFLETERHQELNVCSSISVVGQFVVVVITVMVITEAQRLVPFQASSLPTLEPVKLCTRLHKELHFHLLELAHTEDELAGYNFVTESLTNLGDTERNLHATGFLYIKVIYEDTLCRFRAKVYLHGTIGGRAHFS